MSGAEGFERELPRLEVFYRSREERAYRREDVRRVLAERRLSSEDLAVLLSPAGGECLEEMARKAREITLGHFGPTQQIYAPLYLSDSCINHCVYCGFRADRERPRRTLSQEELREQAAYLSSQGLRQVLLLTGEDPRRVPPEDLARAAALLKEFFGSVGLEVYPLSQEDYALCVEAGAEGLTLYQETYDRRLYEELHPRGPKKDFAWRLGAPERGGRAGFRQINIGALLGLSDWRREVFLLAHHGRFLQEAFPGIELGFSFPRIRPEGSGFRAAFPVGDAELVQALTACRIFLPRGGSSLSTRESPALREALLPLGVTRLSAGSSTAVGGYPAGKAAPKGEDQFAVSDTRSIAEVDRVLRLRGYQPVYQDRSRL